MGAEENLLITNVSVRGSGCGTADLVLATGGAFVSTGSFALPVPLHLCAEQTPLVVGTAGGVGFGAAGARATGGARRMETTGAI